MKDLARLAAVAVLCFAIVGAAFFYSGGGQNPAGPVDAAAATVVPADLGSAPRLAEAGSEAEPAADGGLWFPRPLARQWMGLAGLPDQFDMRFRIPAGISHTGGTLTLALQSDLGATGSARVTMTVNGTRRGEIVLGPGRAIHDVEIELGPSDLLGSEVLVGIAGRGSVADQTCPTANPLVSSAVTLLPSSGLTLHADVQTPEIRLAKIVDPLALSVGDTIDEQAAAIWGAQALGRAGVDVYFTSGADASSLIAAAGEAPLSLDPAGRIVVAGEPGIRSAAGLLSSFPVLPAHPAAWPVRADALGATAGVRTFRGSANWTFNYKLADLPRGRMPNRMDLELATSTLPATSEWIVRVSLNNNLLTTTRVSGQSERIALPVELPFELQGLDNQLSVQLIDTTPNAGPCMAGPDAQAQLLPATVLVSGAIQPETTPAATIRALAAAETVGMTVGSLLSPSQAQQAGALLMALLPTRASVTFDPAAETDVQLSVLTAGRLAALLEAEEQGDPTPGRRLILALPGNGSGPALVNPDDVRVEDFRVLSDQSGVAVAIWTVAP